MWRAAHILWRERSRHTRKGQPSDIHNAETRGTQHLTEKDGGRQRRRRENQSGWTSRWGAEIEFKGVEEQKDGDGRKRQTIRDTGNGESCCAVPTGYKYSEAGKVNSWRLAPKCSSREKRLISPSRVDAAVSGRKEQSTPGTHCWRKCHSVWPWRGQMESLEMAGTNLHGGRDVGEREAFEVGQQTRGEHRGLWCTRRRRRN